MQGLRARYGIRQPFELSDRSLARTVVEIVAS
jgi:hypothetical protein